MLAVSLLLATIAVPGSVAAPPLPSLVKPSERLPLVLVTASWCQWCKVLEHETLPKPIVQAVLRKSYDFMVADAETSPAWMDIQGLQGLPGLVIFNRKGRHLLTLSGYRGPELLSGLLHDIALRIDAGDVREYKLRSAYPPMSTAALDAKGRRMQLQRWERGLYIAINSNNGGFGSPARRPEPELLLEMLGWSQAGGAPDRVLDGVKRTVQSAMAGGSPRLAGEPLAGFKYSAAKLIKMAKAGPEGSFWKQGIDHLPTYDPYLGIRDPVDGGFFRYAAGPGWYHPHFERRAEDNLIWILLLRALGYSEEAQRVETFVTKTFGQGGLLAAVQASNPFYYRLTAKERSGLSTPSVDSVRLMRTQAWAAKVWPKRCQALLRVSADKWPRHLWTATAEDIRSPAAAPDAVGVLLEALAECAEPEAKARAKDLAGFITQRWTDGLLPLGFDRDRLHRLAAGICRARPSDCGRALHAVRDLAISSKYAPALVAAAQTQVGSHTQPAVDGSIRIRPRTLKLLKYPCGECHERGETAQGLWAGGHDLALAHTGLEDQCSLCHLMDNKEQLTLRGQGEISFNRSHDLCGACHSKRKRDWQMNAHGKQTGGWKQGTIRLTCVECHDPHTPGPLYFKPEPPLVRPPLAMPRSSNRD